MVPNAPASSQAVSGVNPLPPDKLVDSLDRYSHVRGQSDLGHTIAYILAIICP